MIECKPGTQMEEDSIDIEDVIWIEIEEDVLS